MKTNLDIAKLAQDIQDKSSDNVSVGVKFSLGKFCLKWEINICVFDSKFNVAKSLHFNPYSNMHQLELLAKHGYNSYTAAL